MTMVLCWPRRMLGTEIRRRRLQGRRSGTLPDFHPRCAVIFIVDKNIGNAKLRDARHARRPLLLHMPSKLPRPIAVAVHTLAISNKGCIQWGNGLDKTESQQKEKEKETLTEC